MLRKLLAISMLCGLAAAQAAEVPAAADFRQHIRPILEQYCFDCHADGENKGGIAFDDFKSDEALLSSNNLWSAVLKNLRSGIMPPQKKSRPSAAEQKQIADWIKYEAFGIDPQNPDPGRVTVRRLNRVEYRNTIHDLMGVDYDTATEFPPDDTGYGFDDIGDVLTLSPMLMEKYMDAAKTVVSMAVPTTSRVTPERAISGQTFVYGGDHTGSAWLSYYEKASYTNHFDLDHPDTYQLVLDIAGNERYVENQFDYNKCRVIFKADGEELLNKDYVRASGQPFHYEYPRKWEAGPHALTIEIQPLTPDEKQIRSLTIRIDSVTIRGPMEDKYWVTPKSYRRFFAKDIPPGKSARRAYAREYFSAFATKAFRRPVADNVVNGLVDLAEKSYSMPGGTFEAGVARAMTAVLASPRFLFHIESTAPSQPGQPFAQLDEYSLASRLSYFLWSTQPDD